jgi:phage terminase large subunit-like protein
MNSPLRSALRELADPAPLAPSPWYCDRPKCDGKPHKGWTWKHARAHQRPPLGDWLVWFIRAGRGYGKTRSGAEYSIERIRTGARRWALVGRSAGDIREVMVEGESGIMACSPNEFRPKYEPSKRRLTWPNGAIATTYSAEEPSLLRGPEHDGGWCDEISSWPDAFKGDRVDTAWNNFMLGLRLGADPRAIVTATPKPNKLTREISAKATTALVGGSTYDNLDNLAPTFKEQVLAAYEGTRIGRQELEGELLDDVEGALWAMGMIEGNRFEFADEDDD